MTLDLILFLTLAAVAVATALGMLASRSAVYSVLFLVMNFITVAVVYLLLNAAFIAMVQVAVYAGAIMVLFLFVVMLLGAERLAGDERLQWQKPAAAVLGLMLLGETGYVLFVGATTSAGLPAAVVGDFGSPAAVGLMLFNDYLVPIEVASLLLLVAMVGAIVLSRDDRKKAR